MLIVGTHRVVMFTHITEYNCTEIP